MFKKVLCSAALAATMVLPAQAANFSFTGTFAADNDVQIFSFSVGVASTVTLQALSYGGGVQADGNVVSAGGFDNILSLFDANTGELLDSNDDGTLAQTDPTTGAAFDSSLEILLNAGDYLVAVTQYDNFASGSFLSDGFNYDSPGNETFTSIQGCSNGIFCDVTGDNRTNAWAFDILNVDVAVDTSPIPLPAGMPLMLVGVGAFAAARRLKR